jgi:hypothetical protein
MVRCLWLVYGSVEHQFPAISELASKNLPIGIKISRWLARIFNCLCRLTCFVDVWKLRKVKNTDVMVSFRKEGRCFYIFILNRRIGCQRWGTDLKNRPVFNCFKHGLWMWRWSYWCPQVASYFQDPLRFPAARGVTPGMRSWRMNLFDDWARRKAICGTYVCQKKAKSWDSTC